MLAGKKLKASSTDELRGGESLQYLIVLLGLSEIKGCISVIR